MTGRARVDALLARIDALPDDDVLALHREVCRRAARIYEPLYRSVRDAHFTAAMAIRDTRYRRSQP